MPARLVVDSSVAVKWLIPEPHSEQARLILDDYERGETILLAPDLIYAEVGNIVWKKQAFQGLAATDAQLVIDTFHTLAFSITPSSSLLKAAYPLAVKYQRTVYDMLYVALSLREQCRFVTADEKLVNAISNHFSDTIWIANWTS